MKNSELITLLQQYPPDLPVYIFDKNRSVWVEPELEEAELIAVTEFGCEKICDPAHAWQYGNVRKVKAVTIR
ncbi:hypothetical protein Dehly_0327 [Dehalogenimonas lykanthroporepellens BL-DC-9]|nr:hypothetical protein Dehly_0327 [Dehalogenimonas lykanthroporepellens BL-DC-9]